MYMYISSTPTSLGDCYLKKQHDWCNTRIIEQESVVSTKTAGSLPCLQYTGRISCGLRQSALIGTNPRFRKGVGGDGYHKVFHREERGYGIHDKVCRCLGWGEGEEEEGEEDYMPICEVEGEFKEVLNLLIENGRRRSRGGLYKCCSAGLGRGRSLKGGSFCAERRISGRVCVDRPGDQLLLGSPCSHLRKTMFDVELQDPYRSCYGTGIRCVGKGSEHLGCECRWRKCVRQSTAKASVEKQGSSRGDLLIEEERRYTTGLKGSLSDWRNRIRWISTLELENEEERVGKGAEGISLVKSLVQLRGNARWASGVGSCRREETVQKDNEISGLERSCTESRNETWASTVDSRNLKETFRERTKKSGSNALSKGTCHSTVQFKETVDKATQTSDSKALLSNWRTNVRQSSTVVSNKKKLAEETIKKSSFQVPLNNVSNTTQVSIQEQQDRISLECGENSGTGLRLEKDSRDQTVQIEGGPSVSCMPSGISIHTTECNSSAKSEERERDENTTEKLFSQSQDELYLKENTKKRLEKNRGELVSGMTSADSKKMTLTKTTERLAFQKTDELFKGNVTRPSTALNKEKEENVETTYERLSIPIASNRSSQKLFTDSFSSESDTVFSSGTILEKKTSTLDYGKGNEASQKLFETSSYTPICNEISHSSRGKTQSTRIVERTNRTSENLFQTAYSKRKEENIKSFVDHETDSKMSSNASGDFSSKVTSNEMLGMATESKSRYIVETETDMTSGKSTQIRLSDVSNSSLGMVSAEGTENHGSTEKISLDLHSPLLTSGDNPTKGPSEEVWAIGGWSSREEFDELRSSGKEKEENDSTILASEEPLNKLQKNMDQHPISESEEGQVSTSKKNGKVIVKRPSRGIWGTFLEVCSKGWGMHEESETSAQRSGSGRPSTESTEGEGWFSVPELDDDECTTKEKAAKDKKKIATKTQKNILISDTGENTGAHLNESEKTQKEKGQSSDRKMALEGSVDKLKLTRRRFSTTTNKEHELQEQGKQERTASIVDPKKAQVTQQEKMQKAAGNWSLEGTSGYELPVSTGPVPSELYKEHGQMEKEKGKVDLVSKEEREEHEDTERLIQRSEIEEKKKMTKKMKRSKQVPKETFISWEEALVFESEQRQEDEKFMREALSEARMAADAWEVPVGAVLVHNGRIVARAHNLVEETRDATAHAEMLCIRYASNQLKTWRLAETTLYVTLEPCPMCAGAILQARIGTVVWGAPNKLLGADGSWVSLFPRGNEGALHSTSEGPPTAGPIHPFHPNIKIRRGVLASDCSDMMQQFFKLRRQKEKKTQSNSCFSLTNYPTKLFTKLHDIFSVFCL